MNRSTEALTPSVEVCNYLLSVEHIKASDSGLCIDNVHVIYFCVSISPDKVHAGNVSV